MNVLKRVWIDKRHLFRYMILAFAFGAVITLWLGSEHASATGRPSMSQQPPGTLPPPPKPTTPPPPQTPTPRPERQNPGDDATAPTVTAVPNQAVPATQPVASITFTGTIDAPILNVRGGPGTSFPVIGRLDNGTVVTILARNGDGGWLNICCLPDSQEQGWVSAAFVKPAYSAAQAAAMPVMESSGTLAVTPPQTQPVTTPQASATDALTGVVSAISLNVRAEPSTTGQLLGRLRSDAVVSLLGRNTAGDWWLVCCIPGVEGNGWVAAEFITPDADSQQLAALPVATGRNAPAVVVLAASTVTVTEAAPTPAVVMTTTLSLAVTQQPAVVVQGDTVVLSFVITNTGDVTATLAELSFEVPPGLTFVSASANDGGEMTQEEAERSAEVVVITWPELPVGATTTARIVVAVDSDLTNGTVVDGYVVAQADNAESTFVSILAAMPPAEPPDFQ